MSEYLDLNSWPRLDTYRFFRHFDKPYFNVCVQLNVSKLVSFCKLANVKAFLAYHYLALQAANEIPEFHYRLRGDRVLIHKVVQGGSTLLLPNDTFSFVYFDYNDDFGKFATETARLMEMVKSGNGAFEPRDDHDALIHFTTLPWISFTSFSHARNWGRDDSVPKIAFGKFSNQMDQILLPMSVEVHHALMDGVHVGRFINKLELALEEPEAYLKSKTI